MTARSGVGLIELVVALMLLSVGVLGLVATAIVAQKGLTRAAGVEASARAAAAVIDSLLRDPAPAGGARVQPGLSVTWTVTAGDALTSVVATVEASVGDTITRRSVWHAARAN